MVGRSGGELMDLDFEGTELVSTPMDLENTLQKVQSPPIVADMAKMNNIPFREGIDTERAFLIVIDVICTEFLEDVGVMHSSTVKHVFKSTKTGGDIRLSKEDEEGILPNAGEVPQHREMELGDMPMVDDENRSWPPKRREAETERTLTTEREGGTKAEGMRLRRKIFPPPGINKHDYQDTTQANNFGGQYPSSRIKFIYLS
jgi:hypothetical protein